MTIALPDAIFEERIIAVARGQDATTAPDLAASLHTGGLNVLEITVEAAGGIEAIAALADGTTVIGAGTVTTLEQASSAVAVGASFLVSPHLDEALMAWSSTRGVPFIPGVFTPTEIHAARMAGARAVKLYPASLGGPTLLRGLLGPYPDLAVIPTGGVDGSNAAAYLEAGAVAVGVGGWLTGGTDPGLIAERARLLASIAT